MKTRNIRLDVIRCLAVMSVLLCHSVESVLRLDLSGITSLPPRIGFWKLTLFTIGRLGVPLFLFLTGYLMLPKNYDGPAVGRFYKTRLLPMLLCWECWIVIYRLVNAALNRIPWSFPDLVAQMFFLKPIDMMHGWYMPMILGMYFFLPYISCGVQKLPGWLLITMAALGFLNWMIIPFINLTAQLSGSNLWISWLPDLTAGGGLYGTYLLTGYLLYRYRNSLKSFFSRPFISVCSVLLAIILIGFTGYFQLSAFRSLHEFRIWYDWPLLIIISFLLWGSLLYCRFPSGKALKRVAVSVSKQSFGMYLVHMPVVLFFVHFRPFGMNPFVRLVLLFLLLCPISWVISFLGSKIPFIGKLLFYRK